MKKLIYFATILALVFTGCTEDSPSVNTQAGFSIQQETSLNKSNEKTKTVVNPLNGNITFSKVLFGVSKISIKQENKDSKKESEVTFNGPYVFNVLTGTSNPPIAPAEAEPGKYSEVSFKIDNVLPDGNSIEIYGTYEYNNISFNFEFTTDITHEFEIDNEHGLQISEGDIAQFILFLDVKSLFEGIDITHLKFDIDNVVRINLSSNSELSKVINYNFSSSMHFDKGDD
jgi:hypothetical protein